MIKKLIAISSILFLCAEFLWAADEPKVVLQKVEGRTEARVGSATPEKPVTEKRFSDRVFSSIENGIMGFASTSSNLVGTVAEISVKAVRRGGGLLFSPFFKALDFAKHSEAKKV